MRRHGMDVRTVASHDLNAANKNEGGGGEEKKVCVIRPVIAFLGVLS